MSQAKTCPYCRTQLTTGRYGNTWRCLLCGEILCARCVRSGICAHHYQELTPEQIAGIQKTYRNHNFIICGATIGYIIAFIVAIVVIIPTVEHSVGLSIAVVVVLGLLMMGGIVMISKKAQQISTKAMNEIYPPE